MNTTTKADIILKRGNHYIRVPAWYAKSRIAWGLLDLWIAMGRKQA